MRCRRFVCSCPVNLAPPHSVVTRHTRHFRYEEPLPGHVSIGALAAFSKTRFPCVASKRPHPRRQTGPGCRRDPPQQPGRAVRSLSAERAGFGCRWLDRVPSFLSFREMSPRGLAQGPRHLAVQDEGAPQAGGPCMFRPRCPPNFTVLASLSFISSDLGSSRLCNPPASLPHPKPGHRPTPRTGQAVRTTKMKAGTMVAEVSRESCAPSARRSAFHVLAALRGRLSLSRLADENDARA